MIFSSEKMAYDGEKYTVPLWRLDTESFTIIHINESSHREERTTFHSECIRYHINYISDNYPERFQKLVNSGEILDYLETLETKVYNAVDRQLNKWKSQNTDYLLALSSNDYIAQARIENMLEMQAREMIYSTMVYA